MKINVLLSFYSSPRPSAPTPWTASSSCSNSQTQAVKPQLPQSAAVPGAAASAAWAAAASGSWCPDRSCSSTRTQSQTRGIHHGENWTLIYVDASRSRAYDLKMHETNSIIVFLTDLARIHFCSSPWRSWENYLFLSLGLVCCRPGRTWSCPAQQDANLRREGHNPRRMFNW